MAVVCNKNLFRRAGLPLPQPGWTWAEFIDTAHKLTDASKGVFGTGWPGVGDEDTTWRLWPMVWDLGGEIIGSGGKSIGFADQGRRALETIASLVAGKSVYIDPKPGSAQMYQVFLSGRMGMVMAGPWHAGRHHHREGGLRGGAAALVQRPADHHLGPRHLDRLRQRLRTRRRPPSNFVQWLIAPDQDVSWDIGAGSLPLSVASARLPAWADHSAKTVGLPVFTKALESARVRPVHPAYPQISQAFGEAVVASCWGVPPRTRPCASAPRRPTPPC